MASNIVLSGDAILESATAVALLGGAPGAFAQLSADNSITVTSPTLTLVNGRSFARMLVPTQSTPITVSGLTTGYFPVSGFEFTGLDAAPATQELGQILAMNPVPVFVEVTTPLQAEKKEEPEIAVDAGETCQ